MTGTRPTGAPITENYEEAFTAVWPAVSARISAVLAARGAGCADLDDVLQTTAERALTRRVPFEGPDDLFAWAYTVARRALIDLHRRRRWVDPAAEPPSPVVDDVERRARGRLALAALVPAIGSLGRAERSALEAAGAGPPGSLEARRDAVRRFRARAKLATVVEGILAWLLVVVRRLRRRTRLVPAVSVAATVGISMLLVLPGPAPSSASDSPPGAALPTASVPSVHRAGAAAPARPARFPARTAPPAAAPPPAPAAPSVGVTVQGIGVSVSGRPTDHILCHSDPVLGGHCLDWPAPPPALERVTFRAPGG